MEGRGRARVAAPSQVMRQCGSTTCVTNGWCVRAEESSATAVMSCTKAYCVQQTTNEVYGRSCSEGVRRGDAARGPWEQGCRALFEGPTSPH